MNEERLAQHDEQIEPCSTRGKRLQYVLGKIAYHLLEMEKIYNEEFEDTHHPSKVHNYMAGRYVLEATEFIKDIEENEFMKMFNIETIE